MAIAAQEIQFSLLHETSGQFNTTALFSQYRDSVVGIFVGGRISNRGVALRGVQQFIDHILYEASGISKTLLIQHCGPSVDLDHVFGIIADTTLGVSGIARVQSAVKKLV